MASISGVTHAWTTSEISRRRNSFNAIVSRVPFDAPEDDVKYAAMGRQAEFGPEWVPNPIIARVRAGTLTPSRASTYTKLPERNMSPQIPDMTGSFGSLSMRHTLAKEMMLASQEAGARSLSRSASRPGSSQGSPKAMQLTPMKPGSASSPGRMSAMDTTYDGGSNFGSLPCSPMSASRSSVFRRGDDQETTSWSPAEMSIYRHSLNTLVAPAKAKFDTPAALMMDRQMGRKAEYDGNYTPNAIYARRMNGTLRT
jgi:hypothetical protein|mmetsp:Transcript_14503/g.43424  ORF Transcript_14503/g.43424 Transcript_14503/m.43424 type:complete len:255 (-) Transcript_14503:30-794(-)